MLSKELLKQTLIKMGVNEQLIEDFDLHSTVELELNTKFSIFISEVDDNVWIWSKLNFMSTYHFENYAFEILKIISEFKSFVIGGQYSVGHYDDIFELKALASKDALMDGDNFSILLETFFNDAKMLEELCE
ncbi:MAG: hypothetical protein ACRCRU_00440 [Vibrio sp.]|uniref:InvB/SpaK family type III secretion system chaperone n=1 Tax=Vibrio TaxID=662 RepID=UPI00140E91F3|nr:MULTISPECIES: SPI-1 type III secretion system chaperone SpaK [unclassified Vibrio]QIL85664.1 SPI-1 type III secretion system chaperone SpaK [Vibrio sp. HDW18]